jgi:branched-subunit amino acid ABC-type transport system permease component
LPWKMAVSCALITCLGPIIYRIFFQPLVASSPLVLLIAAVATHLGLNSIGLHLFGPEGVRTEGFSGQPFSIFGMIVPQQAAGIIASSGMVVVGFTFSFACRCGGGRCSQRPTIGVAPRSSGSARKRRAAPCSLWLGLRPRSPAS